MATLSTVIVYGLRLFPSVEFDVDCIFICLGVAEREHVTSIEVMSG